jgi:hypothetical protein
MIEYFFVDKKDFKDFYKKKNNAFYFGIKAQYLPSTGEAAFNLPEMNGLINKLTFKKEKHHENIARELIRHINEIQLHDVISRVEPDCPQADHHAVMLLLNNCGLGSYPHIEGFKTYSPKSVKKFQKSL